MVEQIQLRKCKQEACKVGEEGRCLEGLESDTCPHFYFEDGKIENVLAASEGNSDKNGAKKAKFLFSGKSLNISELGLVSFQYECLKIFILGESDSGKTTLIATIFDLFQKKPIGDILYAGSLTQIGFEERCHFSRSNSKAKFPATEKTKSREFDFLHLALQHGGPKKTTHLLLSDISGEILKNASNSSSAMKELGLLELADKIIIIIDGAKIAHKLVRHATLFKTYNLIQRGLDEGVFGKKTKMQILLSKWDILADDTSFDFDVIIKDPILKKFENRLGLLQFSKIASRPETSIGSIPVGFGIHELLTDWIEIAETSEVNLFGRHLIIEDDRWFNKFQQ
jgi:hypothetical protein